MVNAGDLRTLGAGLAHDDAVAEMRAFDALPAALRAALAGSLVNWSARDILGRWRRAAALYGEDRATRAGVRSIQKADANVVTVSWRKAAMEGRRHAGVRGGAGPAVGRKREHPPA